MEQWSWWNQKIIILNFLYEILISFFIVFFLLFFWLFIKKVRVLWFHEKMWSLIIFLYVSNSFICTFYLMRLNFCKNSQCGNLVTKLSPTQGKMLRLFKTPDLSDRQSYEYNWQKITYTLLKNPHFIIAGILVII